MHTTIGRLANGAACAAACAAMLLLGACRERHQPLEPTVPAPAPAATTPTPPS